MNLNILQFDVSTAFLHGDLSQELYLRLLKDVKEGEEKIMKLNKSLYGLKQSPRNWNHKFRKFIEKFNLEQSKIDPCLFYNVKWNLILVIYVDDGLVATKDDKTAARLIEHQ